MLSLYETWDELDSIDSIERKPFLQKAGYIAETYLLPESRGKGVGTALFRKAIGWFEKRGIHCNRDAA